MVDAFLMAYDKEMHVSLYNKVIGGFDFPSGEIQLSLDEVTFSGWFFSDSEDCIYIQVTTGSDILGIYDLDFIRPDVNATLNLDADFRLGFFFKIEPELTSLASAFDVSIVIGADVFTIWHASKFTLTSVQETQLCRSFLEQLHSDRFSSREFYQNNLITEQLFFGFFKSISAQFSVKNIEECLEHYNAEMSIDYFNIVEDYQSHDFSIRLINMSSQACCRIADIFSGDYFSPIRSYVVGDINYVLFSNGECCFYLAQHSGVVCLIYPSRYLILKLSVESWVNVVVDSLFDLFCNVSKFHPGNLSCDNQSFLGLNVSHSRPYHYFYDYLNGVFELSQSSELTFDAVSVCGFDFYNLAFFPNISNFTSLPEYGVNSLAHEKCGYFLAPSLPIVNLTKSEYSIDSFRDEVRARFTDLSNFVTKSIESDLEAFENFSPLTSGNLVIWIGVSSEKRQWVEQVSGVRSLINELKNSFKTITVIIDGRTFPLNPNDQDFYISASERDIFDAISSGVDDVLFINSSGLTARQKLIYASSVDIFFTSYATDSMYPSAFLRKKGVVYVSPVILESQKLLHVHYSIIEVPSSLVRQVSVDKSWDFSNVSMDWQDVYKCIANILNIGD
ncbi:MAG: hypothetical protein ACK4XG_12295 [Chromatiaceae bacterium]|jgi:hypothetical protein